MNVLNRIIVMVGLVLTILCAAATIVFLAFFQGDAIDLVRRVSAAYPPGTPLEPEVWIGGIIIAAVASLIAVILLWAEVVPSGAPGVRLNQVGGSNAIVTTDAIRQRVQYDAETVHDVRAARPLVRTNGRIVDVRLDLRLAPGVDVPPLIEEVGRVVREGVESKMGVNLRRLNIYVRHEPYGKRAPAQKATRESLL